MKRPVTEKRKAAIVRAVKKRRKKVREMAVAEKGGIVRFAVMISVWIAWNSIT